MEVKLNGVNAVVALVLLGGFAAYRMSTMRTELETDALQELKLHLAAEYAGKGVASFSGALQSNQPMSDQEAAARTQAILAAQSITFPSVSARGMWRGGGDVVARVEIQVDGGAPPDGDSIRYYRMQYRGVSGWDVKGRTSAWAYWLKLF
jgi:hypothetical protein